MVEFGEVKGIVHYYMKKMAMWMKLKFGEEMKKYSGPVIAPASSTTNSRGEMQQLG